MKAKVYDFDPSYDAPDGTDDKGEYVLRDINYKSSDNTIVLKNGTRSHTYETLPAMETICEICNPAENPLCTQECQEVCPKCINYKKTRFRDRSPYRISFEEVNKYNGRVNHGNKLLFKRKVL